MMHVLLYCWQRGIIDTVGLVKVKEEEEELQVIDDIINKGIFIKRIIQTTNS